jgi:hypothetical protein
MGGTEVASPKLQPRGPQRTVSGTLQDVKCTYPSTLKLNVQSKTATLQLRAANYYKVEYSTLNYKPEGDLNPCHDLEGMKAKVTYYEGQSGADGIIAAIQLSK